MEREIVNVTAETITPRTVIRTSLVSRSWILIL